MERTDNTHRWEYQAARFTDVSQLLVRALYLLPPLAAAVALATPVAGLRLPRRGPEQELTLTVC